MKQTRLMMGMPITVEIVDEGATTAALDAAFDYFAYVDGTFSTHKSESEISRINAGELTVAESSPDMKTVFALAERTRRETNGYFNIACDGRYDPSGIVKGWAIYNAAMNLRRKGFWNLYVDAGGDIQTFGRNPDGQPWRIGIRHPFKLDEIVKVIAVTNRGVATSGNTVRGEHIYNPHDRGWQPDIVSLTVIGPDVYEADRFATAAFAMDRAGIEFIARLEDFEGYMIDRDGRATFTPGFDRYVVRNDDVRG